MYEEKYRDTDQYDPNSSDYPQEFQNYGGNQGGGNY